MSTKIGLTVFLAIIIFFSSCDKTKYLYIAEEKAQSDAKNNYQLTYTDYKIQSGDVLNIQFHSTMTDVEQMFNFSGNDQTSNQILTNSSMNGQTAYFSGYTVSDSGMIRIPVLGYLNVSGRGLLEIEKQIENEAKKYVKDIIVKVKLYGLKITFLGEFKNAGIEYFFEDRIHLLDAIGARPMLNSANRKEIRIIRQTSKGLKTFRVDITNKNIISDPNFFLQPNDIVYAEPLTITRFRYRWADYTFLLGTITSTLALIVLITNTSTLIK